MLADLNLVVDRVDDRRREVVATGLPLWGGTQLAIDTTLVAPLTSNGQPRRRHGAFQGDALLDARVRNERAYPELVRSNRCHLFVFALEVGGHWSTAEFVRPLAAARARSVPASLQQATAAALLSRWVSALTHAAMSSFADSPLGAGLGLAPDVPTLPPLGDLLPDSSRPSSSPVPLAFQACRLPSGMRELQKATKARELSRNSMRPKAVASQTSAGGKEKPW